MKLGEVDAALVYRTDAKAAAADVDGIEFPESAGAINDYPIVAAQGRAQQGRRGGVRGLRPVGTGGGRADRGRVPEPVTQSVVTSTSDGDLTL